MLRRTINALFLACLQWGSNQALYYHKASLQNLRFYGRPLLSSLGQRAYSQSYRATKRDDPFSEQKNKWKLLSPFLGPSSAELDRGLLILQHAGLSLNKYGPDLRLAGSEAITVANNLMTLLGNNRTTVTDTQFVVHDSKGLKQHQLEHLSALKVLHQQGMDTPFNRHYLNFQENLVEAALSLAAREPSLLNDYYESLTADPDAQRHITEGLIVLHQADSQRRLLSQYASWVIGARFNAPPLAQSLSLLNKYPELHKYMPEMLDEGYDADRIAHGVVILHRNYDKLTAQYFDDLCAAADDAPYLALGIVSLRDIDPSGSLLERYYPMLKQRPSVAHVMGQAARLLSHHGFLFESYITPLFEEGASCQHDLSGYQQHIEYMHLLMSLELPGILTTHLLDNFMQSEKHTLSLADALHQLNQNGDLHRKTRIGLYSYVEILKKNNSELNCLEVTAHAASALRHLLGCLSKTSESFASDQRENQCYQALISYENTSMTVAPERLALAPKTAQTLLFSDKNTSQNSSQNRPKPQ